MIKLIVAFIKLRTHLRREEVVMQTEPFVLIWRDISKRPVYFRIILKHNRC